MKTPAVGDPVLFMGKDLQIVEISDATGRELATVDDMEIKKERDGVRQHILDLREEAAAAQEGWIDVGGKPGSEAPRVTEIKREIEGLVTQYPPRGYVKVRTDLMIWWEARGIWVSPGRILSDAEKAKAKAPASKGGLGLRGEFDQRMALMMLEELGG